MHKGPDKDRKATANVLKLILNPKTELPTFVSVDISRLPAVDVNHVDTSTLFQELSMLRSASPRYRHYPLRTGYNHG